jgi:hypothetical protein
MRSLRVEIFSILSETKQDLLSVHPDFFPPERLERVAQFVERFREDIKADKVKVDRQQFLSRLVFPETTQTPTPLKYFNYIVRESVQLMI